MTASTEVLGIDAHGQLYTCTIAVDFALRQQAVIRIAVIHDRDGHAILVNGGIYHHDLGVGGGVTRHIGDGGH
ncbi:hypothetical protein J1F21_14425, partial [Aeromonas veronii]|uniref:hypothetical protein n=1 Tax=Aeromonas veronii TaxID=654 RepID=UPI001A8FC131